MIILSLVLPYLTYFPKESAFEIIVRKKVNNSSRIISQIFVSHSSDVMARIDFRSRGHTNLRPSSSNGGFAASPLPRVRATQFC